MKKIISLVALGLIGCQNTVQQAGTSANGAGDTTTFAVGDHYVIEGRTPVHPEGARVYTKIGSILRWIPPLLMLKEISALRGKHLSHWSMRSNSMVVAPKPICTWKTLR